VISLVPGPRTVAAASGDDQDGGSRVEWVPGFGQEAVVGSTVWSEQCPAIAIRSPGLSVADGGARLSEVVCEREPSQGVTRDGISGRPSYQDQGAAPEIISGPVATGDLYDLRLAGPNLAQVPQQLDKAEGATRAHKAGRFVHDAEDSDGDRQIRLE
jgi:hypothetical protein